jgi:hypothetical protein
MSPGFLFRPHSLVTLFQFLEGFDVRVQIDSHLWQSHPPECLGWWLWQDAQTVVDHAAPFLHFLNPVSNGALIDCTTSIHSTQPFVNVLHTFFLCH